MGEMFRSKEEKIADLIRQADGMQGLIDGEHLQKASAPLREYCMAMRKRFIAEAVALRLTDG